NGTRSNLINPDSALKKITAQLNEDALSKVIEDQAKKMIEDVIWKVVPDLATQIIERELKKLLDDIEVESPR
ncbi:MAG: hypothetical protein KDD34_07845, partial [Bdellovibrionales bacterium]|nr:hypothetical protein [Bdellovibrionales bacterium]